MTSRGTVSFSSRTAPCLCHETRNATQDSVLDSRRLEADRSFVTWGFWAVSFDYRAPKEYNWSCSSAGVQAHIHHQEGLCARLFKSCPGNIGPCSWTELEKENRETYVYRRVTITKETRLSEFWLVRDGIYCGSLLMAGMCSSFAVTTVCLCLSLKLHFGKCIFLQFDRPPHPYQHKV